MKYPKKGTIHKPGAIRGKMPGEPARWIVEVGPTRGEIDWLHVQVRTKDQLSSVAFTTMVDTLRVRKSKTPGGIDVFTLIGSILHGSADLQRDGHVAIGTCRSSPKLVQKPMKTLVTLLLALAACAPSQTLHFEIRNTTTVPLTFSIGEGVFHRMITLNPGEQWLGSIDPRYVPKRLPVIISTK